MDVIESTVAEARLRRTAKRSRLLSSLAERDLGAERVVRKRQPARDSIADPIRGRFKTTTGGPALLTEYEPDPDLRDTEQVPLLERGGIKGFLTHEVLPWAPDAWYDTHSVKIGYEINFTRHFFSPEPMRPLADIRADLLKTRQRTDATLDRLLNAPLAGPITADSPPHKPVALQRPQTDV